MLVKSLIKFEYELGRKNFSFGSALHGTKSKNWSVKSLIKFEYDNEKLGHKNFSFGSALHYKKSSQSK